VVPADEIEVGFGRYSLDHLDQKVGDSLIYQSALRIFCVSEEDHGFPLVLPRIQLRDDLIDDLLALQEVVDARLEIACEEYSQRFIPRFSIH
jgi:hypothetical protein